MTVARAGFSIIELLVVVSIISILAGALYFNINEGAAQSRDAQRQSDLRNLQSAIELYRNDNGRYPEGCNGAGSWSGQIGASYACPSGGAYIIGLAPKYIPTLPEDPRLNGNQSGYAYTTNADGSVYKLIAKNTVESETVAYGHPFQSCDADNTANNNPPYCNSTHPSNSKPGWCLQTNAQFQSSYGVWAGFANVPPNTFNADTQIIRRTEDVICDLQ